jgi:hypothetical protein
MTDYDIALEKAVNGANGGLTTGLSNLDRAIGGIQRGSMITIASSPKVGKTTFTDFAFLLSPYIAHPDKDIQWTYWSYEIPRIRKAAKFACYFLYNDYGIKDITINGKKYPINPAYIEGKFINPDDGTFIPLKREHAEFLKERVFPEKIYPLLGKYDVYGRCIKKGKVNIIENPTNPTGLWKYIHKYAKENGELHYENYTNSAGETARKLVGYTPNNPDSYHIFILDHVRKVKPETGFSTKQIVDKTSEYFVECRNLFNFTFIPIIHMNRDLSNINTMGFYKDWIFPTSDMIKDSGNLSEDSDIVVTIFNPNDDRYKLTSHMGEKIRNNDGSLIYPNYRSVHVVESRDTECPSHVRLNMFGNINSFSHLTS